MKLIQKKTTLKKIVVFGHKGLIGSAIIRNLKKRNYSKIATLEKKKVNLLDESKVNLFFKKYKPKIVFIAAARVGGINANSKYPFNFLPKALKALSRRKEKR